MSSDMFVTPSERNFCVRIGQFTAKDYDSLPQTIDRDKRLLFERTRCSMNRRNQQGRHTRV